MLNSMNQRRTIRRYTDQSINDELLHALFTMSARGSTCGNMQLYSVIRTTTQEGKAQLAPLHFNQPMVMQAPLTLTFCVDFRRFSLWCAQRQAKPGYNNLLSFLNAAIDTLIFAERFATAAEEEGLGICYLGTALYTAGRTIETLKLPQLVFPLTALTVGYPDEQPAQTDRLPLEAILHNETYQDYTPQDIDRHYAEKESLPENLQYIAENHKETLAQVFTDVRYRQSDNEAISADLLRLLKQQGFL